MDQRGCAGLDCGPGHDCGRVGTKGKLKMPWAPAVLTGSRPAKQERPGELFSTHRPAGAAEHPGQTEVGRTDVRGEVDGPRRQELSPRFCLELGGG